MNDANTRAVLGEYVSVYDIQQAVIDKATVPIYYESRIAKLSLNEAEFPRSISRKSPKGKKRIASRSSRPSGPRWKHSSAARGGFA
jgi:type I site-specific restriction-modification system R (restriction) subunit